eukprot:TRINITY_DN3294_c3_g8_i2.p1 TRINITY_DN3294_c3_g8~~TRINITY_DN3294_c3_g8_i2.p1  ORF type:complete len:223 (+),score=49.84 TRINITY_DN3294_c3_g8_i2:363-1031(+)
MEYNEIVCQQRHYEKYVWRLAVSNDGRYLAVATDDKQRKLLSTYDLSVVREFTTATAGLRGVSFSLDSEIVIFSDNNGNLKGFNVNNSQEVISIFSKDKAMRNPTFINNDILIAGFWEGDISVYHINVNSHTTEELTTIKTDIAEIWCGCFMPNENLFFVGGTENTWECFQLRTNNIRDVVQKPKTTKTTSYPSPHDTPSKNTRTERQSYESPDTSDCCFIL